MAQDPLIGRVVDSRYKIVDRVARGGMATVYRAQDRRLDRLVALKVMHAHLAESSDFVSRFRREARAAARLSNPGVVAVFDQGSLDGVAYLVMEYVEGPTLRNLVTAGPLSVSEALELTIQVLRPLGAAHRAGLVHRDIKPENVLLPADGSVAKVADFGLARAVTETTQTTTGNVLGTAAYLAPELITSGDSSPRADVFSVGVMLYEMLTGVQPFRGETPIHIAFRNVHEDVPAPSALVPELPASVDQLVAALAARDPQARPSTADAAAVQVRSASEALKPEELAIRRSGGLVSVDGYGADLVGRARAALKLADGEQPVPPADSPATAPADGASAEESSQRPEAEFQVGGRTVSLPVGSIGPVGTTRLETSGPGHTSVLPTGPRTGQATPSSPLPAGPSGSADQALAPTASASLAHPRRRALLGLGALGLLGLGGSGAGWYFLAGPGRRVSVPDITGMSAVEAEQRVADAELKWKRAEDAFSDTVAAGVVISTTPEPGRRLAPGTELTVVVSKGIEQVTVPEIVGKTKEEATKLLSAAKLRLGAVTEEYSASVASGQIVSCTPEAGATVNHSSAVAVAVSKGKRPVTVPDVVGMTKAEAEKAIKDAGLKVGTVQETASDTVESGKVISSNPSANTANVFAGDAVDLVVSKGQQMVTVPDVSSMDEEEAKTTLEQAGFIVQVQKVRRPLLSFRDVADTDPAAGSSVKYGSNVTLKVYD
ncbi:Serine/threonine-protein kinase PrkC [Actinomyces bovis]|uniref:non-specific serine/threonine protein kinase n=1 Tax=Actinomyces bovis TaxID=1658 RepID=A0ABY1VK24_9ACTO|nr:Stk1 family PASTA domain-containing Ser/Thr kinase [Actinomyces bovis]SPT52451.1 Serine/threonine-protein kinase PrkC [Actinomyces bovis]VEG54112.1 Serine/threonine-protein kinase PrkC [Actinomyces israelii]